MPCVVRPLTNRPMTAPQPPISSSLSQSSPAYPPRSLESPHSCPLTCDARVGSLFQCMPLVPHGVVIQQLFLPRSYVWFPGVYWRLPLVQALLTLLLNREIRSQIIAYVGTCYSLRAFLSGSEWKPDAYPFRSCASWWRGVSQRNPGCMRTAKACRWYHGLVGKR